VQIFVFDGTCWRFTESQGMRCLCVCSTVKFPDKYLRTEAYCSMLHDKYFLNQVMSVTSLKSLNMKASALSPFTSPFTSCETI
jgi:hypothetical protein